MSATGTRCSGAVTLMHLGSNLAASLANSAVTFRSAGLGSSAGLGISMRSTTPGSLDGTGRRSNLTLDVHMTVRWIEQHASATNTDHHLTVICKRLRKKSETREFDIAQTSDKSLSLLLSVILLFYFYFFSLSCSMTMIGTKL